MKKNASFCKYLWPAVMMLCAAACVGYAAYTILNGTNDYIGLGTAVILFFTALIVLFSSIIPMISCAAALDKASRQVADAAKIASSRTELFDALGADLFPKNKVLSYNWLMFKRTVIRNGSRYNTTMDDIQDYFNADMLRSDVAKFQLFDMIPGFFTGLGILGTFVGLMIGLKSFSIESADTMLATIPILIDGIKIAFVTSIYGIAMSLTYSISSLNVFKEAENSLFAFVDCYHENVNEYSDFRDALGQIAGASSEQAAAITKFTGEFTSQLAIGLNDVIAPTINEMQSAMDRFIDIAGKSQVEGMERIVDKFILSMDRALGNRFEAFSRTIDELNTRQRDNALAMKDTVSQLVNTTGTVAQVNEEFGRTIMAFRQVQQATESMMDNANSAVKAMGQAANDMQSSVERMHAFLNTQQEQFTSYARLQQESFDQNRDLITSSVNLEKNVAQLVTEVQNQRDTVARVTSEQYEGIMNAMGTQITSFGASVSTQAVGIQKMYDELSRATEKQLAEIQASMKEQSDGINAAQKALSDLSSSVAGELRQLPGIVQSAYDTLDASMDKSFEETFKKFDEQLASISLHLSGTISEIRDVTDEIPGIMHEAFNVFESELKETAQQIQNMR